MTGLQLLQPRQAVGAKVQQGTFLALRAPRGTGAAAAADELDLEVERLSGGDQAGQVFMGMLGPGPGADEAEAPTHAMHVRVHGQYGLAEGGREP